VGRAVGGGWCDKERCGGVEKDVGEGEGWGRVYEGVGICL
jgi:hypothetical protein